MDNEILELLRQMNEKFDRLEAKIDDNTKDIKEIKGKLDITYDQVARTAEDITIIKDDLVFVEQATSKNWNDIAKLKSVK